MLNWGHQLELGTEVAENSVEKLLGSRSVLIWLA